MEFGSNRVVCPECGKVRLETPPGTKVLPTLGMARKAAGTAGDCGCGKHRPEAIQAPAEARGSEAQERG